MKRITSLLLAVLTLGFSDSINMADSVYQFEEKSISGEVIPLSSYEGKVLLIVNTASECGYTPQYKGLQELYEEYQDEGLVILGFPANNFGGQEPGSDEEIAEFCEL
ncbi:MAG TPA: glutathione peroxidase, partial [Balneolaceae bacterium]|nr:glutathione peroxidase [Balneolaceae bacterium]